MSIATEITRLQNAKAALKTAINAKGGTIVNETLDAYAGFVDILEIGGGGGGTTPSTGSQNIFTGATIPLTYKDNTHTYENTYIYKSGTHNITIAGLDARATITGNGTKEVTVTFDVTSATSSLKNFTITCVKDTQTLVYNGMHAHYGTTVTGILTFAYKNVTPDGSEGTIGTNYLFIESTSTDIPLFASDVILWNTIYSYQLLNILMGNYSLTSIGHYFMNNCYSFNQPLDLNGVESIGTYFMYNCYAFNQPIDLSGVTSIGTYFMNSCRSFNQPIDLSGVESIGDRFMYNCSSFNQPIDLSGVASISTYFMSGCSSFNQPIDLSGVESIGDRFMYNCYSFNQPIDLSGVASISTYFMSGCSSFNQPIDLSGVASIGFSFMYNCYAFNQPIDLSGVTSIGTDFMYNCSSLSCIIWNASTYPISPTALSLTSNSKTSTSGSGIVVYGTKRAELMAALTNRTSSPYRKLINGGY